MHRRSRLALLFTKHSSKMTCAVPNLGCGLRRGRVRSDSGKVNPILLIGIVVVAVLVLLPLLTGSKESSSLVSNPGFETGSDQVSGWTRGVWPSGQSVSGVDYIWDKGTAHSGNASLCLKKTAQRYFPVAQWSQTVSHKAGASELRVSAWVKADQAYKAILDVQHSGGHEWAAYIGAKENGDPPANHDWQQYSGTVSIPSNATEFTIDLQIYGPGTVWFDDVEAEYVD